MRGKKEQKNFASAGGFVCLLVLTKNYETQKLNVINISMEKS